MKIRSRNEIRSSLEKVRKLQREKHHPVLHEVHKKHGISKQTLFYIKEYGEHSNVAGTIVKESLKMLLLASLISSFGGFVLSNIQDLFLSIFPLVLLLPSLNNMIGNYGTIISSRFSAMLYEGKIEKRWWKTPELKNLFSQIIVLTFIGAILSSLVSVIVTYFSPEGISLSMALKIFTIVLVDMFLLANLLFFIAIFSGLYFYRKKEDPNNLLIPLTTSIADFSNMAILAGLIILLF